MGHDRDEGVRVDTWLWAVRMYKTRTAATAACRGGLVTLNDKPAKAASLVGAGDRVSARAGGRLRVLEVVTPLTKRVGAPVAAAAYVDHSPPEPPRASAPVQFERARGAGRPTKRDRRQLDRLRSEERRDT